MGSPFSFPDLNMYEGDPDSRFLNLFNTFSDQYSAPGQFLQPDDPDLQAYQELANKPTGSEDLLRSYAESMPTREDFNPSTGRRIAAFLLGTLSGNPVVAERAAREHLERPYEQAVDTWKMEGSKITSEARLMDAERQRQLQAMKYGLQTKSSTLRSEATRKLRELAESRRIASEVAEEEARDARIKKEDEEKQWRHNMQEQIYRLHKDNSEWQHNEQIRDNTARDEARKARDAATAAEAQGLDRINKDLSAYASQHGIDTSARAGLTALDIAKALAMTKARDEYKFFGPVIDPDTLNIKEGVDSQREEMLRKWLAMQVKKYLRGDFPRSGM